MSYVKLFKVTSDFALGYQTLNQGLTNNLVMYQQLDEKHSVGNLTFGSPDPFLGPGKHDDFLVARTAAHFEIDATGPTPRALTHVSGPMVFGAPEYLDDGKWKIYITTPRLFGVATSVRSDATSDYRAQSRVFMDLSGPYVIVTTWDVALASRLNLDFSLVVWAESVA
jgi:hypothetical protein